MRNVRASDPASARLNPTLLLSLQAFDLAIRLGSFKAAAELLRLTPSAISHRIRKLERAMGERLFERLHRHAVPTAAGKRLAGSTGRAFAELAQAVEVDSAERPRRLRLSVFPLFSTAWLIPRLAAFIAAHPDIELVIETSTRIIDFDSEPIDAAIRSGGGHWPGLAAARILQLQTTPVATPTLAKRFHLRTANDLRGAPLIQMTDFPGAWKGWLERAGCKAFAPRRSVWVEGFSAAIGAAEQGAGVALALEPLVDGYVAAGRLCRPLPISLDAGGCWLVHRPADRLNPALGAFKRWLLAEAATSAKQG